MGASLRGCGSMSSDYGGSWIAHPEDLDVPDATFTRSGVGTFCRLDEVGLEAVEQRLASDRAVLACQITEPGIWCRWCGCRGSLEALSLVSSRTNHLGWRPITLVLTVSRYQGTGCSMCGAKTPPRRPSHARKSPAATRAGHWKCWSCSISR